MPSKSSNSTNVGDISTKREIQDAIVSAMADRVRECAARKRFNATTLGEALGIPSSSASNYWSGKRAWPTEVLVDLAAALATNVEYLLTGVKERGAKAGSRLRNGDAKEAPTVEVAELDLAYGLGGTYIDDMPVKAEPMRFTRDWLRNFTSAAPDQLFFARGAGDSMVPTIFDSDIVLIDCSQSTIRMGDQLWAIAFGSVGMIKRLRPMPDGSVAILSDNPQVPEIRAVDGEMHVIGRVVAIVRKV